MKAALFLSIGLLLATATNAQLRSVPDSAKKVMTVEASCGTCNLGLKAKGCSLAVRIDGKAYFVDGTTIDDHGDAHADDGFCEVVRKAEVQGELIANRFKVTYFKLLPLKKAEPGKQ